MIEVEHAIRILRETVSVRRDVVSIPILKAKDCVTANEISAPINIPHFSKSAMDGYAIYSADSHSAAPDNPLELEVLGELCPGDASQFLARPGTAVRIMTGAAVPSGYDAVIKQEDTDYGEDRVKIYKEMSSGENYCPVGEDVKEGQPVIARYTRLTSQHIGILAGMGYAEVSVVRPFRAALIATGNELVWPDTDLKPAQIYNSSIYTMAADLQSAGVEVVSMDICQDDCDKFQTLADARIDQVDIIITTGGVSAGKSDFLPDALKQLGAVKLFHRVRMKPGTPVLAGQYRQKPLLCLSGNPFAAQVNFHLFFWPVFAKAMQNESFSWKRLVTVLAGGTMKSSDLRRFVRAYKDDEGVHLYTHNHQSSVISNLVDSNCLIDQPAGMTLVEGDQVSIIYW